MFRGMQLLLEKYLPSMDPENVTEGYFNHEPD